LTFTTFHLQYTSPGQVISITSHSFFTMKWSNIPL
jgi:hypothetical protein